MLKDVLFALWFLLPAADANMAPILAAKAPLLRRYSAPIDGGLRFRGKPLFGSHKTWRGIISGTIVGTGIFWLQQLAVTHWSWLHMWLPHSGLYIHTSLALGALLGFGALAGDALKSFFKRQFSIASGKSWLPFDQLDYILGAVLFSLPFVVLSAMQYIWVFIIWFGMHVLFTYIGWRLGLKESPI